MNTQPFPTCANTQCAKPLPHHISQGGLNEPGPRPGDISICAHCLTPSFFTLQGKMHRLTKDDIAKLSQADRADIEAVLTFLRSTRNPLT